MGHHEYLIVGGVHKAGTTSLYTYLSWHPDVCASAIKETHFFSGQDASFAGEVKFSSYDTFFSHCKGEKVRVESSPEYIYGKENVARRINNELPEVKLIFILRNPVEKIISSFAHKQKKMNVSSDISFDEYANVHLHFDNIDTAAKSDSPEAKELMEGCYIDYLPAWFNVFDRSKIKIIFFDDLATDPVGVMNEICAFIDIDPEFYRSSEFTVENKSVGYINPVIHKMAIKLFQIIEPAIRKSYRLKNSLRTIYYMLNGKEQNRTVNDTIRDKICGLYAEPNQRLEKFLLEKGHANLPAWLKAGVSKP